MAQAATSTQSAPDTQTHSTKNVSVEASRHRVGGAVGDILWALVCLSLPMIVLTAILIGLVYGYEVSNRSESTLDLSGNASRRNTSAIYIDYSATRLLTVSSWTSTVTSFTTSLVMVLAAYPIAKSYMTKSGSGAVDNLPTTYQLSLIIGLLAGGLGPLWTWFLYATKRKRSSQIGLLWLAVASVVGGLTLSLAILGADTWLHITTSTVALDVIAPVSLQPVANYGRTLLPLCYNTTWTPGDNSYQCIGGIQIPGQIFLRQPAETAKTAINVSSINRAETSIIKGKQLAYLTAAQREPGLDFRARTYAVGTECNLISKACGLQEVSYCAMPGGCALGPVQLSLAMQYNCSKYLYGDLDNSTGYAYNGTDGSSPYANSNINFFQQLFGKPNFANPIGSSSRVGLPNPFYFAVGAQVTASDNLAQDPEIVQSNLQYNNAFLMSCQSTIYELEYTFVNGSIVSGTYDKTNATFSDNLRWTLFNARAIPQNNMELALLSGAIESNTSQQLADSFAEAFSTTAISMLVGITEPSSNLAEQARETRLVTRLPKAPFFTLIVLNLLYALLGIILATIALANQPRVTRNVQARLTIAGLVAALLEPDGGPLTKKGNSGIDAAFSEHYSEAKIPEDRVMLLDSAGGNAVFQKVSIPTSTKEKAGPTATS